MTSTLPPEPFRVLCIEDEPEILRDIVEELRDHGFLVDQALTAEAALSLIRSATPDLIVCDMQLPGMSGLDLLQNLRNSEQPGSTIPFVFLTAFGDRETMIDGRRAGADDYLVKPVDFDLLIAAVESHLHNAARRADQIANEGLFLSDADGARDSARLLTLLDSRGPGTPLAIAKIDNMAEGLRRFAHRRPRFVADLARRLAAIAGLDAFWINAHTLALTSDDEARLHQVLERMVDFRLRDRDGQATKSVQISFSIVTSHTESGGSALRLLDQVMEGARLVQREGGKRKVALGSGELHTLRLAGEIRASLVDAIREGELHVCFQPIVRVRDGLPVCAEVLVRWESPTHGSLSPGLFIPVIERAGLVGHVTDWVLEQAARHQSELLRLGLPARLAVNVGAAEFTADLPDRISRIFGQHQADLRLLEVEITETSLITNPAMARAVTNELHARGVTIALDDFGTGFSSLSNLQTCSVDAIKIDRSFVDRLGHSEADRQIVTGIMQLASLMGLETVAEGVERVEQQAWLTEHGCGLMQGYLFARPVRFEDYCSLMASWIGESDAA